MFWQSNTKTLGGMENQDLDPGIFNLALINHAYIKDKDKMEYDDLDE